MDTLYDYSKLLGRIKECGYTHEVFARQIDVNPSTFSKKINNESEFKQEQIRKVCDVLQIPIDSVPVYFFTQKLGKTKVSEKAS